MLMITRVTLSTILSLLTFIFYFVINIIRKCIRHTKNPNWIILSLGIKISIKKIETAKNEAKFSRKALQQKLVSQHSQKQQAFHSSLVD